MPLAFRPPALRPSVLRPVAVVGLVGLLLTGAAAAPAAAAPQRSGAVAAFALPRPGAGLAAADALRRLGVAVTPAAVPQRPDSVGASFALEPSGAVAAGAATTSAVEARRVGAVRTPHLRWYACYGWAQCATAKVPLDYDRPHGAQTTIALLRVRAKDRKNRIGSLFVNPGGPGGSSTTFALIAPAFLSESVLSRFDIVGMDPRGIGAGDAVACFTDPGRQAAALKGMTVPFPVGAKQTKAYLKSARKLATACSTTGRELAGAMSTAEVARDMDVMRRAVGDKKLNYLGFSYGTALGQYYANMFPDRFRTLAVDGVIDPRSWAGSRQTRNVIQDERLRSAEGAYRALIRVLTLCDKAGEDRCAFAAGDPVRRFATLAGRLRAKPVTFQGVRIGYADFVGLTLGALYQATAGAEVTELAAGLWTLTSTGASAAAVTAARRAVQLRHGRAFPYDNTIDAYASVMCTDGLHPAHAASWPAKAARADRRAPYFGQAWAWSSAQCARDIWKVRDEDAYRGPFAARTRNTVLVVGSYWDPATNYYQAVSSADRLPNSRLLSSDNFGHTGYGTSTCVTRAMDHYLLYRALPARGTVCRGTQPFTKPLTAGAQSSSARAWEWSSASKAEIAVHGLPPAGAAKVLPPVDRTPF